MKYGKFTTKLRKNIDILNFIDDDYGTITLYKSKKRLELRLSSKIINKDCSILLL